MYEDAGLDSMWEDRLEDARIMHESMAMQYEETKRLMEDSAVDDIIHKTAEELHISRDKAKYPSFKKQFGREPVVGIDFDENSDFSQDDYEYYTGTGRYSDIGEMEEEPIDDDGRDGDSTWLWRE